MSFAIFIILVFMFKSYNCDDAFAKNSKTGAIARIDLINSLKIALNLSQPPPTEKERNASFEFVKFLDSWRSNEYVEAFYASSGFQVANRFMQFLNGILFNGNPALRIWRAAETISTMISTKVDTVKMEEMRELMKRTEDEDEGNPRRKAIPIGSTIKETLYKGNINYFQIYNKSELVLLKKMLESALENSK